MKATKRPRNVSDDLPVLYSEAAQDPAFQADNDAVAQDFAMLDRELDAPTPPVGSDPEETRP